MEGIALESSRVPIPKRMENGFAEARRVRDCNTEDSAAPVVNAFISHQRHGAR
jgi:hypothetical protein